MIHQSLEVSGQGFLQKIARHVVEGKHSEATEEVRMLDASNMIESCSTEVNQLLAVGGEELAWRSKWFATEAEREG